MRVYAIWADPADAAANANQTRKKEANGGKYCTSYQV